MNRTHQEIQEELTLWALGIAPDAPLPGLAEHLANCGECRRLVREVYETTGLLASAVKPVPPPEGLKEKILGRLGTEGQEVQQAGRSSTSVDRIHTLPREPGPRGPLPASHKTKRGQTEAVRRTPWTWLWGAAAAIFVFGLLWGNISLNRKVQRQEEEITAWVERYEADFRWLRSAEYLLVQESEPAFSALLAAPAEIPGIAPVGDPGSGAPTGKATIYTAYDDRFYLIVWVSGLLPGATYEVWAESAGAASRIASFAVDERGSGSVASPSEGQVAWTRVEVRGIDETVVLRGELRPGGLGPRGW